MRDPPRHNSCHFHRSHDKTIPVIQYLADVNAKNSYGAYPGSKPAICYVDMGETRVLDLKVF